MNTQINENNIPLTLINDEMLELKNIQLLILREDIIHPEISGNKWRKLKYNLQEAKRLNYSTLLTFGGAYSNHIAATAAAGKHFGFNTIGIIRGDEILPLNSTLSLAKENGMIFKYISREMYRNNKYEIDFLQELKQEYGEFYLIPEGGSNVLAVKGCTEIVDNIKSDFDLICVACGTGGTIAGIISSTEKKVLGFPALKGGEFLVKDINKLLQNYSNNYKTIGNIENWQLITDYHFGGFAKVKPELIDFVKEFKKKHNILLDYIYTGKMLFGLFDIIKNSEQFNGKKIIVIHTGGLQGNKGFEEFLNINV